MADPLVSILLALFAVFGLYCLVRLTVERIAPPRGAGLSVEVTSLADVWDLPDTLRELQLSLSPARGPILVIVSEALYGDPDLRASLEASLIGLNAKTVIVRTGE